MDFDVLIIGGGAAGMSCALVIGSGLEKPYSINKRAGIIMHQKSSHLQDALFNNVLGIKPKTPGKEILKSGQRQLSELYPQLVQIKNEKVLEIRFLDEGYEVITNKGSWIAKTIVVAVGYTEFFGIRGLDDFVIPHQKAKSSKNRIQLKNKDHIVVPGIYVAGTIAGWRSQFATACGSGAAVATDILTIWNNREHTKVHDKLK